MTGERMAALDLVEKQADDRIAVASHRVRLSGISSSGSKRLSLKSRDCSVRRILPETGSTACWAI